MAVKKDIDIRIVGTSQDVRLLKKIFSFYLGNKASESEKGHIQTYLGLIDHAVERANESE